MKYFAFAALLCLAAPSFADSAPPSEVAATVTTIAPVVAQAEPGTNPAALLQQLLGAVDAQNWLLAIPLLVLLAVWLARIGLVRLVPWFGTDPGGAAMAIAGAIATAVIAAAALPGPHTVAQVVLATITNLVGNEVFFRALKKLGVDLSVDPPKARADITPGAATGLFLVVCLVPLLGGCNAHLKPGTGSKLIDCAEAAVASQVTPELVAEVAAELQGRNVDWQSRLDKVVAAGGAAAICALVTVASQLELGGGGTGGGGEALVSKSGLPVSTVLTRAYVYLGGRELAVR
ncbi:MAG: hypothetical protein HY901_36015 [Deltaproteobacteria bacterium]|nr:hypothetical protein [Deltaproteobacteria bacterium]